MVENKCEKCGQQVQYTIKVRTDKESIFEEFKAVKEYWCLPCLFGKAPPMGNREDRLSESIRRMTGNLDGKVPFVSIGSLDTDQQRAQGKP